MSDDSDDEGAGIGGIIVVGLERGIGPRLLADEGKWRKHFEAVCPGALLEASYDAAAVAVAAAAGGGRSGQASAQEASARSRTSSLQLAKGAHVTVYDKSTQPPSKCPGRIVERMAELAPNGQRQVRVHLADGSGDKVVEVRRVLPRQAPYGEAWIRPRAAAAAGISEKFDAARAELFFHVLCTALAGNQLPWAGLSTLPMGASALAISPEAVRQTRGRILEEVMASCNVVGALAPPLSEATAASNKEEPAAPQHDGAEGGDSASSKKEQELKPGLIVEVNKGSGAGNAAAADATQVYGDAEILEIDTLGVRIRWCSDGEEEVVLEHRIRREAAWVSHAWQSSPGARLVICGQATARCTAHLRAMALIETHMPGAYTASPPTTLGTARSDLADSPEGLTAVPTPGSQPAEAEAPAAFVRHLDKVTRATGAFLERVGPLLFVAGPSEADRRFAATLVKSVDILREEEEEASKDSGGKEVHSAAADMLRDDDLMSHCTRLRVPEVAAAAVRKFVDSEEFQKELPTVIMWAPPGGATAKEDDCAKAPEFGPGDQIQARALKYGKKYYEAEVVQVERITEKVVLRWNEYGTKMRVLSRNVRTLQQAEMWEHASGGQRRQMQLEKDRAEERSDWLASAKELLIFGRPRLRKVAALRALAFCEHCCTGLWSSHLEEALVELNGVPPAKVPPAEGERLDAAAEKRVEHNEEDVSVEGKLLSNLTSGGAEDGMEEEEEEDLSDKALRGLLRRAARAAGCDLQFLAGFGASKLNNCAEGATAFVAGTKRRRELCWEYFAWLVDERRRGNAKEVARNVDATSTAGLVVGDSAATSSTAPAMPKEDKQGNGNAEPQEATEATTPLAAARVVATSRPDVDIIASTRHHSAWLEPCELREIEEETKTLLLLDHTAGEVEEVKTWEDEYREEEEGPKDEALLWKPKLPACVFICGADVESKAAAVRRVAEILEEMPPEEEELKKNKKPKKKRKEAAEGNDGSPNKKRKGAGEDAWLSINEQADAWLEDRAQGPRSSTGSAGGGAGGRSDSGKAAGTEAAPAAASAAPGTEVAKTDPKEVIRSLAEFPSGTQAWIKVQDTIWAGHSKLAPGWIRIWSRSKDTQYYYRLEDGKTTFQLAEVQ
eukprot:TRINITY_DN1274_c0_g2_i1.p1 TRINITY_DN1274_c0_g2~~TRINITY_DN1274_c0_g2_i1.p1  ORF type:complete len:1126 (+),score=333.68 TRINITY_DN1274_c0_g2_i1:91-3468(+)